MATYNGEIVSGRGISLDIKNGDTAYDTIVRNSAALRVSNGGYVERTTVYNNATFSNGGIASTTFLSGGTMTLLNGGTADVVSVLRSAKLTVLEGGVATNVYVSSGNVNATVKGGDDVTKIEGTNELGSFYLSNGVAANFLLNNNGQLTVLSGGTAQNTHIKNGAQLTVSNGGVATGIVQDPGGKLNTTIRGGDNQTYVAGSNVSGTFLLSGGVASGFILYENTAQHVSNGGVALDTIVISNWAHQFVYSGGVVSATSVYRQGSMTVYDDGVARDTVVYAGGSMMPVGGEVFGATVYGELLVTSGNSGEEESGGIATLRDVNIASGGVMKVIQNAKFGDGLTVAGQAELSANMTLLDGASLVLDISTRGGDPTAILSDWTKVVADDGATFSITVSVSDTQARGIYTLAANAESFDRSITVRSGETELGALAVGGSLESGAYTYSLGITSTIIDEITYTDLVLTVEGGAPTLTAGDLNGDGRADVIMSITEVGHGAEGATGAWLIQGDQTAVWGDLSQRNDGWAIFGTGATTAGKTTNDVYVISDDNVVGAWTTDETGKVSGWASIDQFDADTQVLGLGDFNGDGQTDLLLRNVNGAVGCYFTSGETLGWNYFQSLGDEWSICAVGDLNGDGRDDVVLKHDAGFAGSWLTQSDYTMAWADLDTLPEGYSIIGSGDFNGDGIDDVLLRNGTYYGAWIVENGNAKSWMGLGDLGEVTVEQIADFDGDGIDDLRIRTTAGDLGAQLVKGADTLEWKYYGSVGTEWSTSLAAI